MRFSVRTVMALVGAVVILPVVGVALAAAVPALRQAAMARGLFDVSFVAYVLVALLLFFRWRVLGDAASVSFLAASTLIGMLIVPATTQLGGPAAGYVGAVRAVTVALLVFLSVDGLRCPDVRSDIRPAGVVGAVVAAAVVAAVPIAYSPARLLVTGSGAYHVSGLAEAAVCAIAAGLLLRDGIRRRSMLRTAFGVAMLSVGMAVSARPFVVHAVRGAPSILPSLSLGAGAVVLLVALTDEARQTMASVVLYDIRGRRRWEEAESQLTEMRHGSQGRRHDVRSMLSAVDGALLVLSRQREHLSSEQTDELIAAVREQVLCLQALCVASENREQTYSVSELLAAIVSVRSPGQQHLHRDVQPGLAIHGRPDRLAMVMHNLLANAAQHAAGATVGVRARRAVGPGGDAVEIVVSDSGPGIPEPELDHALQRGWRGTGARRATGQGLGLFQCHQLVKAEGGTLSLGPTDPSAPAGHQGLTVRVVLPTARAVGVGAMRISSQMHAGGPSR